MFRFALLVVFCIGIAPIGSADIVYIFENQNSAIGEGLDDEVSGSFTQSGLELTATSIGGLFNATSGKFGINQAASGDDTSGFDFAELPSGPGVAEGLTVSFDDDVLLRLIDVSSFGTADQISVSFSGGPIATVTDTGSTSLGDTLVSANDPITIMTTTGSYGNGWSLDFIDVSVAAVTIPEPSSSLLLAVGTFALAGVRRRR